jgi:uncharacterized protein (UPF0548 family)
MQRRPKLTRRWMIAVTWPIGIALTSWDYMWRATPLHRSEKRVAPPGDPVMLALPPGLGSEDVQGEQDGHGLLFHRRYETVIGDSPSTAEELMAAVKRNLNRPAPSTFARFEKVLGKRGRLALGDEFVVRMPGPWDGPVRVIDVAPRSFRLATLAGHLEAGQIEFRARDRDDGMLVFEIESWARSSSRLVNLLYHRLRMAKEVQAHMWISFLEGVVKLSRGRMRGGVTIATERVEVEPVGAEGMLGPPRVRRMLAELSGRPLNFDLPTLENVKAESGWRITDLCQPLPGESAGAPIQNGSWEIARRLMRGYEFADPSIVRAYYDPSVELEHRNMVLELRALGVFHLYVGVRVGEVYERTPRIGQRPVRVWGWNYRTLEGHVEMGQMDWEVWKWLDSGDVEFRVHSVSRDAPIANPIVALGFRLLRSHERMLFLDSTKLRMRKFVELALRDRNDGGEPIRAAAAELTARRSSERDPAHAELARGLNADRNPG